MSEIEIKDFQDEPSDELADALNEVAKLAREKYGEVVFSKFLYNQAFLYRTKVWQLNWMMYEKMEEAKEAMEEQEFEEDALDIKKEVIH